MKQGLLPTMQQRGYWRINFRPLVYQQKVKTLGDCDALVRTVKVGLRGWSFPHYPSRRDEDQNVMPASDYVESWTDNPLYKECWRMYQSGQFIDLRSLKEDWLKEDGFVPRHIAEASPPGTYLAVELTTFHVTEFFEYLRRLTALNLYDEGVKVDISLNNTENRELRITDPARGGFWEPYRTAAKSISYKKELTKEEVISRSLELTIEALCYFYDRFGWSNPPIPTVKKDIEDLLAGRA